MLYIGSHLGLFLYQKYIIYGKNIARLDIGHLPCSIFTNNVKIWWNIEYSVLTQLIKPLKIGYILAAILDLLIFLYYSSWFWFYKWIFMRKYTNIQELINFHKASSQIVRILRKIAYLPSGGHLEFFILSKIYTKIIILVITYDIIQFRDQKISSYLNI